MLIMHHQCAVVVSLLLCDFDFEQLMDDMHDYQCRGCWWYRTDVTLSFRFAKPILTGSIHQYSRKENFEKNGPWLTRVGFVWARD